jgi:uncharacterized radical SAM superfamily Fe-S cluster-containing enzyme
VTLKKALNDHEIGRTIEFALQQPCVRGVTFQPVQHAGRADGYDPAHDRLTLTEVRRRILEQSSVFRPEDVIPVPCHPDSLAMDENIFRIIITQFIDAHAFDVRSVKKSCVHIVHPHAGRLIPFDTSNLFYRDDLEARVLAPLRQVAAAGRQSPVTFS